MHGGPRMTGVMQSGNLSQQGHLLCGIVNTHGPCISGASQGLLFALKNETKRLT